MPVPKWTPPGSPAAKEDDGIFQQSFDAVFGSAPGKDMGLVSGSVASMVSAIPELFGVNPSEQVERWRNDHPVADVVTSLAGMMIPYGGVAVATTKVPKFAKALEGATEGTLKAFNMTGAANPVISGALKEFYRYTPLELSRLGTGWAVGDADMGDMFADVGLSQAIAGTLGGVGGFFRAGGKVADRVLSPKVAGQDEFLLPTFQLRLGMEPDARIINGDRDQFLYSKTQEVLKAVPEAPTAKKGADGAQQITGLGGRYAYELESGSLDTVGFLEGLYKPNAANATDEAILNRGLDVRQLHHDSKAWSVGEGQGDAIAQQLGFADVRELAAHSVYPREVRVTANPRGQGTFAGKLGQAINEGALKKVDDATWIGMEEGGLWHVLKRIERGPEPAKPATAAIGKAKREPFQFGPAKVREGDRFFLAKTDKPGMFVKDADRLTKHTTENWAKYKDAFRQIPASHPFAQEMNLIMNTLAPEDWRAAIKSNRANWVSGVATRTADKIKAATGMADQASVHQFVDGLYDIMAPKLAKMYNNPEFGRYMTLQEGVMRKADLDVKKFIEGDIVLKGSQLEAVRNKNVEWKNYEGFRPVREIVQDIDDDELVMVTYAAQTQTPAKDLEKLFKSGEISPKAIKAVEELQALNKHVLQTRVIPALEEAGLGSEITWLEGYIMPRAHKGDAFTKVVDEQGKTKWLISGVTPKDAQKKAQFVIDEAAAEGKTWGMTPVESFAMKGTKGVEDNVHSMYDEIRASMEQDVGAQETVQRALKKLLAEQQATVPKAGISKRLKSERTGLPGTPDLEHITRDDFVASSENHYRQLMRTAAFHSWNYRFGKSAAKWGKKDETAYTDLMRKGAQFLGYEGQLTSKLNDLLRPVLGNVLGGKPATLIASQTNKMMYAWNIGILNPTFAVLNLLTPLMTTAPWIAAMVRSSTADQMALSQMSLTFDSAGRVSGSMAVTSPIKVIGKAIRLMNDTTPELEEMTARALQDGTLPPQLHEEFIGSNSRSVSNLREAAAKGGWEFIKKTSTIMATRSEQFSRVVSFNSAYILGKDFFNLAGDDLYRFARKGTETTMYGYGVMDRSRVLTGPIGSMFGLFKNWQFHFINDMATYAGMAKEGVFAPMVWQGASALAVGGLGATPLVMLADGLAKWNSDSKNSFSYLQENFDHTAADGIYFGLPALLGVSLQASSKMPGTDVTQDITSMTNVVFYERAKAAFKAIGAAADNWQVTGDNPLKNPNIRDQMLQAFAPRAVFRAFSSMEGDYVKSMATGMPTVRDLPLGAKIAHGAGFNITEIEKHYIAGQDLYKRQLRERELVRGLGDTFAQAQLAKDNEAMSRIIQRAISSGVDHTSVLKSANTRYHRETQGDYLSRFDKVEQARVRAYLKE